MGRGFDFAAACSYNPAAVSAQPAQRDGASFMSGAVQFFTRMLATGAMVASLAASAPAAHAQGAFAGLEGRWNGKGTITLSSGARESIRCRAVYAVSDAGRILTLDLRCASDSYQINLTTNLVNRGGTISGSFAETTRGVNGSVSGSVQGSHIEAVASSPNFTASFSVNTRGSSQAVSIRSPGSELSEVSITMRRG